MRITKQHLEAIIEDPYLSRGEDYFVEGLVNLSSIESNKVTAEAIGTSLYKVKLSLQGNTLDGECSCPAFDNFGPCKHIAAVGFAIIAHHHGGYQPNKEFDERKEELTTFESSLMKKSKEELVSLIMDLACEDPELFYMLKDEVFDEG